MRLGKSLLILALVFTVAVSVGCGGARSVSFGDGSAGNLVWGAFNEWKNGDNDKALIYADKLIEDYGAEARELQASLSDYPPTDPPELAYRYNILNTVAAAYLVRGEVLKEEGDKSAAAEAFTTVINDYGYAQFQELDDNTKWWKVADAARKGLAELESDTN